MRLRNQAALLTSAAAFTTSLTGPRRSECNSYDASIAASLAAITSAGSGDGISSGRSVASCDGSGRPFSRRYSVYFLVFDEMVNARSVILLVAMAVPYYANFRKEYGSWN